MQLVSRFRSLLAALEITPKHRPCGYVLVRGAEPKQLALITENRMIIAMLAKMEKVRNRSDIIKLRSGIYCFFFLSVVPYCPRQ